MRPPQGASLDGYQSSIVFNVDDDPKTYLEREVGLEQANRLMSSEVNVWFWDVRFFKPLQREEFRVRVDPAGRIVGFGHILEEAAPGARLERAEALARAQAFLRDTLHTPLENYTFLPEEANSTARPNRTDWSFTWERTGFRAKDAPYRLQRRDSPGDRIAGYQEYLKVPEAWQRSYARLRSSNDFIEELALIPYALLLGAAISVVLALGRSGTIRWSGGAQAGPVHHAPLFRKPDEPVAADARRLRHQRILFQLRARPDRCGNWQQALPLRCSWSSPSCPASLSIAPDSRTGCVWAPRSACPGCAPRSSFARA